jgi:hypothetical protein
MKALPNSAHITAPKHSHALVEERVREAFRRVPLLVAFSLDEELAYVDIEVHSWPGCPWDDDVYGEIDDEISALISDLRLAGAAEFMRGRTFARALH